MKAGGLVVGNAGALPCLTAISAGMAGADAIRTYCTPLGGVTLPSSLLRLPAPVRARIERELGRRRLSRSFERTTVENPALACELLFVALGRFGAPFQRDALRIRNAWFDRAVASRLRAEDDAVLCVYTAARRTIERAKLLAVPSLLYSPIAHHRFAARVLGEEARRVPGFAGALSYHRFPGWRERQLDGELARSDAVVVLSNFQRQSFVEEGVDPARIHVVNLGVDLDLFRPAERPDDKIFRVIFTGQLTQRKGLSYLLEGFEKAAIPSSELLLVGRPVGNARDLIRRSNVRHVQHVPRFDLPTLYRSADVFVFPSLLEGFPQTPLEAMASGLPVVVSQNTYGGDVVEDGVNGFVTPIRDSDAIAERLLALHRDPSWRLRMGVAARRRAEDFDWRVSSAAMLATVDRVVAGAGAQSV